MWMSQYIETPIKAAIIKLLLDHRRIFSNIEGINSYVDVKTWRFEPLVHEQAGISDYTQYRFHIFTFYFYFYCYSAYAGTLTKVSAPTVDFPINCDTNKGSYNKITLTS